MRIRLMGKKEVSVLLGLSYDELSALNAAGVLRPMVNELSNRDLYRSSHVDDFFAMPLRPTRRVLRDLAISRDSFKNLCAADILVAKVYGGVTFYTVDSVERAAKLIAEEKRLYMPVREAAIRCDASVRLLAKLTAGKKSILSPKAPLIQRGVLHVLYPNVDLED